MVNDTGLASLKYENVLHQEHYIALQNTTTDVVFTLLYLSYYNVCTNNEALVFICY